MFENINTILNRDHIYNKIKEELLYFEENKENLFINRGVYLYGSPGSGKTYFITKLLKDLDYNIIKYDAGDIRNKSVIEQISKNHMTDKSVISMFQPTKKKIAVLMDEIDGMNNGDKGGINSLIKLMRAKKTKKQKLEEITPVPIICISDYHSDKKIRELIKVCNSYELPNPENKQISIILKKMNIDVTDELLTFIDNDLRKLDFLYKIYQKNKNLDIIKFFEKKKNNLDPQVVIENLFTKRYTIYNHNDTIRETDRTIIGLLFHENIIDILDKLPPIKTINFYKTILENICFSDYIDRVTFQKQIWKFNEMSSLIKTFYNHKLLQDIGYKYSKDTIRFTKVLTKYSTEYNNLLFIQTLCQQLSMDKKDLLFFFSINSDNNPEFINLLYDNYDIGKLEINRIYRYLENYM